MALIHRHRSALAVGGALASALFMFLAVRRLDHAALRDALGSVTPWPWVPLAVTAYVAGHLVRGARCRLLLGRHASLRLPTAANVVVVGYAANNVFPARLGELVRAGLLSERTGIPIAQSLTITLIERVLDGLAILGLLLLGAGLGGSPDWGRELARLGALVFGAAFAAVLLAVRAPGVLVSVASGLGQRLPRRHHDRLVALVGSVVSAGARLREPRGMSSVALCSMAVWVLEAAMFMALLPALGLAPDPALAAVAMSITNLGLLVPSTPGFIGPFHYFCSQALVASGVAPAVALAYAGVVHLTFYLPVTAWGALAMVWYGVQVGATASVARAARSPRRELELHGLRVHEIARLPARPLDAAPSRFELALVEAIVCPGAAARDGSVERAAAFVRGQLDALPGRLRLLLHAGMLLFRLSTRARYLRGYCELPLALRRDWTRAWAESRHAPLRQLFKPLRATALLAYHDDPAREATAGGGAHPHSEVRGVLPARRLLKTGRG